MVRMEPELAVDPDLRNVLEELREREPIFHRPELGTSADELDRQMAADYWEVGASGRRYSREFVLATLLERFANPQDDPWETHDFHCRRVGPDTYLLTYTLLQGERTTRRLTVWHRASEGWQILYHQGTLVSE